jgi:isocitrate dehydrogenase
MKGVTIARHAVGGIYGAPNFALPGKGRLKVVFEDEAGNVTELATKKVEAGVAMLTTEDNRSVRDYAHAVFQQGLAMGKSVMFAAKSTINPTYDGLFHNTLENVFNEHYKDVYQERGLRFQHKDPSGDNLLIDAIAAKIPQ